MDRNELYRYSSTRKVVFGTKGMVATSQPLAAQAGLDILKKGGNAVDAAVAAAAVLTVTEPMSNGIGGDAFALVWTKGRLHGLNSSGRSPALLNAEAVRERGCEEVPRFGWLPVTVPGVPAAWAKLSGTFGKLPLAQTLEPAACYAEEGFPVAPVTAFNWKRFERGSLEALKRTEYAPLHLAFFPEGRAPRAGERFRLPELAATLRELAETGCGSFYHGRLAEKIDRFSQETGGLLRKSDLEQHSSDWVDPISVRYRGYEVSEIPPNGHGIVALMALNLLKGFPMESRDSALCIHRMIESLKLAYEDGREFVSDPATMKVSPEALLSELYAEERRGLIGDRAILPKAGQPEKGGTVYLCTADGEGNMVSYIQSSYCAFGSGLVVPGTGISLQNRGMNFSMNPESGNFIGPEKRSYHTIIPAFLAKNGVPVGPFGVMGGFMQPQGHLQVVTNTVDFGLNAQQSLDAPRWRWLGGKKVEVERDFPDHLVRELSERGHEVSIAAEPTEFGRGQIIWRDQDGVLTGGSESRADGQVAAW
ncbi:Glutathione hydrolase-like YwrD proenzyme [Caprobacter fermentans]|uniref:Glutathione hydrolase-like YwrD proenzyme n=2 Tax=Caproicibacter fermentans TaxID=2576756 RepID=A0A6N8HWL7_9FIRM|nr:Glutathione hydrolase-like YwrD proenzyme [Caproicibacter fermentans]